MFNAAGTLFACDMNGRVIAIDVASKKVTELASTYDGKRLGDPNDLELDRAGGIYFSTLKRGAVYYCAEDGKVTRLLDDLPGVILSPDEKTLYVIPMRDKDMLAFAVEAPGKLGSKRVFCTLEQPASAKGASNGGDGLTVDAKGNLYITSLLGLQVFNPEGKLLGIIKVPQHPANVTFGGKDLKTLYITARSSLYSVEMEVTGHLFPGK